MYRRITIVGVGLIGGSLGRASKRYFPGIRITGVDGGATLAEAARLEAIDQGVESLEEGIREADLILLCRTVPGILEDLDRLKHCLSREVTVTDVGSTKGEICRRAWGFPKRRWDFVGGHPMAGSEKRGVTHARPDLFRDRAYLLCREPGTGDPSLLNKYLTTLGARVRLLDPDRHDWAVAAVSHLPQMVALGLARVLTERGGKDPGLLDLAGPALREMLRVAGSDYDLWKGICSTNRDPIRVGIDELREHLRRISEALEDPSLEEYFRAGNRLWAVREGRDPARGGESG